VQCDNNDEKTLSADIGVDNGQQVESTHECKMIYDNPIIRVVYKKSPVAMQNLMFTTYGFLKWKERKGRLFQEYAKSLDETQWQTREQLEMLQNQKLGKLIKHAYENVPYYRKVFKERNLKPEDIKTKEDLKKLPYLTKEVIRANFKELTAKNIPPGSYVKVRTSGTSGMPMEYLTDKERVVLSRAVQLRQWGWSGFKPGESLGFLTGWVIQPPDKNKKPFWRTNFFENITYYSSFHISENTVKDYFKEMVEKETRFLYAWPSSIYALSYLMKKQNLKLPLKAVFTTAETLLSEQRKLIEEVFECKVLDIYGQIERASRAGECPQGGYHIDSEYCIIQVENREIISTALTDYVMPLIRYKTGDVGELSGKECGCGRGLPLLKSIEGRLDDFIVTPEGNLVSSTNFTFMGLKKIKYIQVFQEEKSSITAKVVKEGDYSKTDEEFMLARMRERLGNTLKIKVEYASEPVRSRGGKIKVVSSTISAKEFEDG